MLYGMDHFLLDWEASAGHWRICFACRVSKGVTFGEECARSIAVIITIKNSNKNSPMLKMLPSARTECTQFTCGTCCCWLWNSSSPEIVKSRTDIDSSFFQSVGICLLHFILQTFRQIQVTSRFVYFQLVLLETGTEIFYIFDIQMH